MNPLGFLCDILTRFSAAPAWAQLLTKATLLLAVAWMVHFSLARANPRWRTLLWRGVAVGPLLMVVWVPCLPGLAIRVPAPEPVATQPVATESAAIEPVVTKAPSLEPPFATESGPTGHLRAIKGPNEVPAAAVTRTTARHDPVADHPEAPGPVRPLAPPLSWPVTLLGVWALGAALLAVRLATGCAGLRRLLRTSQVVSDELVAEVGRIAAALACRHVVQVRSSRQIAVPFMCGLRRPVMVLPERMCLPDYRRQLPGVIAHELAHVASSDFAWNATLQASAILLWFHPLAWRIGSAHRAACDAVCDAVAVSHLGDAAAYCRTLAQVAIQGAASFPVLGLAMARTCDVRRRIAAIQRGVSAAALRRRAVFGVILAGLLASALLAGMRVAVAEPPAQTTEGQSATSSAKEAGNHQPAKPEKSRTVSMSAEAFSRLSAAEQRALLVRVFQRRLEQSHNLYYELEEFISYYENHNGEPGKLRKNNPETRSRYRHWRLGDSFRWDRDGYENPSDAEPSSCSSYGLNSAEGVARYTLIETHGKRPPQGSVQYPFGDEDRGDRYVYWLDRKDPRSERTSGERLFPYLIRHQDQFEIKSPIAGGKVQLAVPWQPEWTGKPGGKRTYVLDPEKGFLPIRGDSRWDGTIDGSSRPQWRIEKLAVQESRLVGDVWMPTKLTYQTAAPSFPDLIDVSINITETKVSRIEFGAVKPADLFVRFTAGMQIRDMIEGVTYDVDAQGNAVALKLDLEWVIARNHALSSGWKETPPEGSRKHPATTAAGSGNALSMASRFSPADRKRLDAERKALDAKNGRQRTAFATALKVMRSSASLDERVEAGLNVLRTYPTDIDRDVKPRDLVIRELIEIGKPAVSKLTAELDRTEEHYLLRDLGLVLRAISDPRAAPAFIRAIPRMANPSGYDSGLFIEGDPKLENFLREHDMTALEKVLGGNGGWRELRWVNVETGSGRERFQRRLFLQLAQRCAASWSKNWPKYVKSEEEAQLDQTAKALEVYSRSLSAESRQRRQPGFPFGPNVVVSEGGMNSEIRSFDEAPADGFLDLDTGRLPNPPANLVKNSRGHQPSGDLLAWAEREGVDLINIKIKSPDGKWFYAFKPLGMKVWRIENSRYDGIESELREGKPLKLPAPWEGPLAQIDEKSGRYDAKLTASFLFITKEGTCGALRIGVEPWGPAMITSTSSSGDDGHKNVALHYEFIYEKDTER